MVFMVLPFIRNVAAVAADQLFQSAGIQDAESEIGSSYSPQFPFSFVGWDQMPESVAHPFRPELNKRGKIAYISGYPDSTIRPEKNISRAETAMIFYNLIVDSDKKNDEEKAPAFHDMRAEKWYSRAIGYLVDAKILSGYADGSFRPDKPITRAEFAAIAARFSEPELKRDPSFPDIQGHWAYNGILSAYKNGWITGYPDGTFKPDKEIVRAEAIAIMNRMLERDTAAYRNSASPFSDLTKNKWYYADMLAANDAQGYDPFPMIALMYHAFSNDVPEGNNWCVSPGQFEEDVKLLLGKGFTPISLTQFQEIVKTGKSTVKKPILITIDDGDKTAFDLAFPVLQKYNTVGNFFITTGWIGTPFCVTVEDVRTLSESPNAELGMHSHQLHSWGSKDPKNLYKDPQKVKETMQDHEISRDILAGITGRTPFAIAYPHGSFTKELDRMLEEKGFLCFSTGYGRIDGVSDRPFHRVNRHRELSLPQLLQKLLDEPK